MQCRVCQSTIERPTLTMAPPTVTSVVGILGVELEIYNCKKCFHFQNGNFTDVSRYYADEYKISLGSPDHDQLYDCVDGVSRFRTDIQADIVLSLNLGPTQQILDFGAAKGATLKQIMDAEPTWIPHVFDVSEDYRPTWQTWIPTEQQAVDRFPRNWRKRFDLITANFVLEHVPEPVAVTRRLGELLKPSGSLLVIVPDPDSNPGDLLVADHLNHFTKESLWLMLSQAGFSSWTILEGAFKGAIVAIARLDKFGSSSTPSVKPSNPALDETLAFWSAALPALEIVSAMWQEEHVGIYGAGFYGALVGSRLKRSPAIFLDQNPYLHGTELLGARVIAPEKCPQEISKLLVALNPREQHLQFTRGNRPHWLPEDCEMRTLREIVHTPVA